MSSRYFNAFYTTRMKVKMTSLYSLSLPLYRACLMFHRVWRHVMVSSARFKFSIQSGELPKTKKENE